ncbi:carbon-nitrogen hydrolase family protein [Candidatus Woesearchaeota archaeon]|nr:MAG: carbon-nitrogen hydrolase family protein [Candidatus Woesearchaeota archaeon]
MQKKVTIAVAQAKTKSSDAEHNLRTAQKFLARARKKRADLIVFPEDFTTNPVRGQPELVRAAPQYLARWKKLARTYQIDIALGSLIEETPRGWRNVAYYIDRTGTVKGRYEKINLWHPERSYIRSGSKPCTFRTRFGKIGLAICWDIAFPDLFQHYLSQGVHIIICPSFWLKGDAGVGRKHAKNTEEHFVDTLAAARAVETQSIFVFANAAGEYRYKNYRDSLIGHSQISAPFIGTVAKAAHNREALLVAQVDLGMLEDAERAYKLRADARRRT